MIKHNFITVERHYIGLVIISVNVNTVVLNRARGQPIATVICRWEDVFSRYPVQTLALVAMPDS